MFLYHFILAFLTFLGDIFTFCGDFFWRRFIGHGYIRSDPDTEALSRTVFLELSKVILKLLFEAVFCFQDIAEW